MDGGVDRGVDGGVAVGSCCAVERQKRGSTCGGTDGGAAGEVGPAEERERGRLSLSLPMGTCWMVA